MSAQRCEVAVRGAVSQWSLGALVWEIFAHALYQRGQLPLPYTQLLHFHSQLAEVPPRLRQEARMLTALHELSGHLETLFTLSHVPRVLILLGPSPMLPLELYELDFHELTLGGSGDSLCHARYSRHVFHSLFVQNVFGEPRTLPVTSATLLLWAHRDCGVDWFKPKLNYKPPNRGRRVVVAFSNSLEEPLSTALGQPLNVGLLLALSTVLLIILHHNLLQSAGQADPARTSGEWVQYEGQPVNLDPDVIPVVVCAVEERLGGTIATINSVRIHTNARLVFYIVTLRHTIPHITTWIKESVLENINYFIIEFNPDIVRGKIPVIAERPELLSPLNFARFYLGHLIPQHKRAVYLDDDIIVLGDIRELFESPLQDGHAAAFSDDCDAISTHLLANLRGIVVQNMYMAYLNYNKESVSKLGIRGSSCTFNPGVVVANLTEWRRQRISEQLEQWLLRDQEEHLYSSSVADGVATPPMLVVFHRRHSSLPPAWHVRYLGYSAAIRFSTAVMGEAKLLHWNGPFKPWGRTSSYTELWEEWYIPDPTGTFRPLSASFRNA